MRQAFVAAFVALFLAHAAHADSHADALAKVKEHMQRVLPNFEVDTVRDAPIPGFYEVAIGTRLMYLSEDGQYMILGDVVDTAKMANLTEARRAELVADKINGVKADDMIVIGPSDAEHFVTVFTDVDCPYCAKFHRDVPALNEAGVQVRYLLFPRSGIGSKSYKRAVGVWCSEDRIKTVGIAKMGGEVAETECDNPVVSHLKLGREVGISGTPAIVLDDGRMIPGYVPPNKLLHELGMAASK